MSLTSLLLLFFLLLPFAHSFYVPGVAPRYFETGDKLEVKVNKLTSIRTHLPYDYYSLDYCRPLTITFSAENLGEVLIGDRIQNSVYSFEMKIKKRCAVGCRVKLDSRSAENFIAKIDDHYRVNMMLDDLPVATVKQTSRNGDNGDESTIYQSGFRVGFKSSEGKYYIHNHLSFKVLYHEDPGDKSVRVVGFHVTPSSIRHEYHEWKEEKTLLVTCNSDLTQGVTAPQEIGAGTEIVFTYEVSFEPSEIKWASRWDTYLLVENHKIHWFSVMDSLVILLILSALVAMAMIRTVYRDINGYNRLEAQEMDPEQTGWKLVNGDVFRPPSNISLLCVHVGSGIQVFGMTLVTMVFGLLGFLSPSNRGGLMTAMVLSWMFMASFGGFSSAHLYKMMKGKHWKRVAYETAFGFPTIVFTIFFLLNAMIWREKSSGAVPFGTMFALLGLWFGISVPLVLSGSYLGSRLLPLEDPVRINTIPRQIPEQPWYLRPIFSLLFTGLLPFGAVFFELFFVLSSIWLDQYYYMFGFLFLVFIILVMISAEITIMLCYGQLISEDYRWWWRSYLASGSSAFYLFLYCIFFFFFELEITKLVPSMLYFGYSLIGSYMFFLLTGTIGFYSCLWFVRKIYSSVKIE